MAQKDRSKEVWLIPKRVNLHQTICLIDGILNRNYNGTAWNPQKQNNLGVNLKRWGATKDGQNISQQAIRTLVASIPQYLGFVYINTNTDPNTIWITDAGMELWKNHKDELVKVPNLAQGRDLLITESTEVLRQMEKLQITNPIIQKDCESILLFPFRFMLRILLKVNYLDREEIAYFLFRARNDDEVDITVQEINNFRALSKDERRKLINAFKSTHIGNITLVKAPSAGYYESLCEITGIIDKIRATPTNREKSITALQIKPNCIEYVRDALSKKYDAVETYDFGDDLKLWIEYIGNPKRDYPPIGVNIHNASNQDYLIQIIKDDVCRYDDLLQNNGVISYPMFINEEYSIVAIDISTGSKLSEVLVKPDYENRNFDICPVGSASNDHQETVEDIAAQIISHCEARNFAGDTYNYLKTLSKVTGNDKTMDAALRGAYLEYYFYKLLLKLKEQNVIDEVIWHGKNGKYGLPIPAPGGVTGTPDIVFMIDDWHYVLELTTIKPKHNQFSAEGSSVPDHIRIYKNETRANVVGVFSAPIIHERNTEAMKGAIKAHCGDLKLNCMTVTDLVSVLKMRDREKIKHTLG